MKILVQNYSTEIHLQLNSGIQELRNFEFRDLKLY